MSCVKKVLSNCNSLPLRRTLTPEFFPQNAFNLFPPTAASLNFLLETEYLIFTIDPFFAVNSSSSTSSNCSSLSHKSLTMQSFIKNNGSFFLTLIFNFSLKFPFEISSNEERVIFTDPF